MVLFQETGTSGDARMMTLMFLAGFFSFLVFYYAFKYYQKRIKELNLPVLIILDLTTFKIYSAGVYLGVTDDVLIPTQDGMTKQLWAVETSEMCIIPSYGNKEDMIIESKYMKRVVIMLCQIIGPARYEETHEEFCRDVFPPEIYDVPQTLEHIEENWLFVRPFGMRNWIRGMLRQRMNGLRHVYSQLYKIIQKYEQQMEEMYTYYDEFFLRKIQSVNETILSNWQNILQAWDFLLRERSVPLYVVARLLHIPQSKLAYSSLNAALSHGGMTDASRFVGVIAQSVQNLASSLNMSMVPTAAHRMVAAKTNQLQSDLLAEREKNERALEVVKQLAERVKDLERNDEKPREVEVEMPSSNKKRMRRI